MTAYHYWQNQPGCIPNTMQSHDAAQSQIGPCNTCDTCYIAPQCQPASQTNQWYVGRLTTNEELVCNINKRHTIRTTAVRFGQQTPCTHRTTAVQELYPDHLHGPRKHPSELANRHTSWCALKGGGRLMNTLCSTLT